MNFTFKGLAALLLFSLFLTPNKQAYAAEDWFGNKLDQIEKFALNLCETAPINSSRSEVKFTLEGEAEIRKFLTIFGIGGSGALSREEVETYGVLQVDLARLIEQSVECRQEVFERLVIFLKGVQEPSGEQSNWAPIFSPKELHLVPSCEETLVDCKLPRRADYSLLGYRSISVFNGGSSYTVTYPENLGRIIVPMEELKNLQFEYVDLDNSDLREIMQETGVDVSKLATFEVCHCKN